MAKLTQSISFVIPVKVSNFMITNAEKKQPYYRHLITLKHCASDSEPILTNE